MLKYQKLTNKNFLDTNILMFITEKEEEKLYLNNLGLDLDEWISLFNTKENNLDKNDLVGKKSQNLSTTFLVKKVIKKKEVYPLKQNTNTNKRKKEMLLPLKLNRDYKSLTNNIIDKNQIDISSDILYRKDAYYKHLK